MQGLLRDMRYVGVIRDLALKVATYCALAGSGFIPYVARSEDMPIMRWSDPGCGENRDDI